MNKNIGAILLIAGCCIGAGMLGIPVMTGAFGFLPATLFFVLAWAYMAATGLVLLELVLSFQKASVNLMTMAEQTLGKKAKWLAFFLFIFLFYAIMVAYFIAGSVLIRDGVQLTAGIELSFAQVAWFVAAALFMTVVRGIRFVDYFNRVVMSGLAVSYTALLIWSLPHVDMTHLATSHFQSAWVALPIMILSFGFHNLVPSIASYLYGNKKAMVRALLIGSLLPLVIYLVWEFVVLGLVHAEDVALWRSAQDEGSIVTEVLAKACHSELVIHLARTFAFFAIITSLLPVALSCVDFLKDAFATSKRIGPSLLVVIPPLCIALSAPHLFLTALNYAGGVCAVLLFGLLPALMVMQRKKIYPDHFHIAKAPLLVVIIVCTMLIIGIQIGHEIGVL